MIDYFMVVNPFQSLFKNMSSQTFESVLRNALFLTFFLFHFTVSLNSTSTALMTINTTKYVSTTTTAPPARITCSGTVGDCIGEVFDFLVQYIDNLGFFDLSYALFLSVYHLTATLITYPSIQFILFWAAILWLLAMLFAPIWCIVRCAIWPVKVTGKLAYKRIAAPCLKNRMSIMSYQDRQRYGFIAQAGDEPSETKPLEEATKLTSDPPETVDSKPSLSKSIFSRSHRTKGELIRVDCESNDVADGKPNADNCPTHVIHEEEESSICGTVDYAMSQNIGLPLVAFKDRISAKFVLADKAYSRIGRINFPITMTAGDPLGKPLLSIAFTDILINSALFRQLRARYALFAFDMRFILVPQSNSNALGSVCMMWNHNKITSTYTAAQGANDIANYGLFQHVWLQCSSDESAILEVKWPSAQNWFDYNTVKAAGAGSYDTTATGQLNILIGHPLSVPTGVPTTLSFELHWQMVNVRAAYCQAPLYSTQSLISFTTINNENIRNSTLTATTNDDFEASVPIGLDHAGDTRQPVHMVRRTWPKLQNTRGPLDVSRTTLNANDSHHHKIFGYDEMSIDYLFSRHNIVNTFSINNGTPKGNLVSTVVMAPVATNLVSGMLSSCATGYVYDSVDVTFKIPKAAYQTGKLVVVLSQGFTQQTATGTGHVVYLPPTLTTTYDMLSLPSFVIDLNTCDFDHVVNVPWHAIQEFCLGLGNLGDRNGGLSQYLSLAAPAPGADLVSQPVLGVYVLIPPSTSPNVANTVNVITTLKYNGMRLLYGHNPAAVPQFIINAKQTNFRLATHTPITKGIDDVVSLRQIWQGWHSYVSGFITPTNNALNVMYDDIISSFHLAEMFAYAQGSIRLLVNFSAWNCDYVIVEVVDGLQRAHPVDAKQNYASNHTFANNPGMLGAASLPFNSTLYNATWKGCGGLHKPVFVDKNSPYALLEVPLAYHKGVVCMQNNNAGFALIFTPVGLPPSPTNLVHTEIYVSAGDDLRLSHIRRAPSAMTADVNSVATMPPWQT